MALLFSVRLKVIPLQYSGKSFFIHVFIFYAEPVGSKAPTFSTDARSSTFIRTIGHSFGLLCQAQAFPIPITRQVSLYFTSSWLLQNQQTT